MQLHKHSNNNSPVHVEAKTKLPGKKLNVSIFQEISWGGWLGSVIVGKVHRETPGLRVSLGKNLHCLF